MIATDTPEKRKIKEEKRWKSKSCPERRLLNELCSFHLLLLIKNYLRLAVAQEEVDSILVLKIRISHIFFISSEDSWVVVKLKSPPELQDIFIIGWVVNT